jgi:hypothetical protein
VVIVIVIVMVAVPTASWSTKLSRSGWRTREGFSLQKSGLCTTTHHSCPPPLSPLQALLFSSRLCTLAQRQRHMRSMRRRTTDYCTRYCYLYSIIWGLQMSPLSGVSSSVPDPKLCPEWKELNLCRSSAGGTPRQHHCPAAVANRCARASWRGVALCASSASAADAQLPAVQPPPLPSQPGSVARPANEQAEATRLVRHEPMELGRCARRA